MKKLPCPRCGKLKRLSVKQMSRMLNPREWEAGWEVQCGNCCMSSGIAQTKEKAVEVWNSLPRLPQWTTEKPTQDGAYWYRSKEGEKLLAYIDNEQVTLLDFPGQEHIDFFAGQWAGPIPEPGEPK